MTPTCLMLVVITKVVLSTPSVIKIHLSRQRQLKWVGYGGSSKNGRSRKLYLFQETTAFTELVLPCFRTSSSTQLSHISWIAWYAKFRSPMVLINLPPQSRKICRTEARPCYVAFSHFWRQHWCWQWWWYIYYDAVCACLSRKIITSHFRAERRRREVSRPLGLAGRRPALA